MNNHAVDRARRLLEGFGLEIQRARHDYEITIRAMSIELNDEISAPDLSRIERALVVPTPAQLSILRNWLLQHPVTGEN